MAPNIKLVFIGLSITSSWGNGHATTYRALISSLSRRGHDILFLEYDAPWYALYRDMPSPSFCQVELYKDVEDLKRRFGNQVTDADAVVVGSYVKDGVAVGSWVQSQAKGTVAFYDIDTPVTLAKLGRMDYEYLAPDLIPKYDLYLSFSGGAALEVLEQQYSAPVARPLYCSVDADLYYPEPQKTDWDLGYLGTYSDDRQPGVEALLITPARLWSEGRFAVTGPQYPDSIFWPTNVERIEHLPPNRHRSFYNSQRFTLNITREDMKCLGHSPSVRLFEAAACGVPIISDYWVGIDEVLAPDREILIAPSTEAALQILQHLSEEDRVAIGEAARARVLSSHTSDHRAVELEQYLSEAVQRNSHSAETAYAGKG
jgi:spore maturation protein CgeB